MVVACASTAFIFLLQLFTSYLNLVNGITITSSTSNSRLVVGVQTRRALSPLGFENQRRILEAPAIDRRYKFRVDANGNERGSDNNNVNYETGVIPLDWKQSSEEATVEKYLPPHRVPSGTYGSSSVLPIVEEGFVLSSTPGSYFNESWNSRARQTVKLREENRDDRRQRGQVDGKKYEDDAMRAPVGRDTRPVYESNNYGDVAYTKHRVSNDERDYVGPEGNRAREQSTNPNTVTTFGHHRLTEQPHESTRYASRETLLFSTLDWFLTDKGYNSQLHPPTNPIINLILSHYGRYLPGSHQPKIYSYMAVNNIHNNRPFGQYKLSCDEGPDSQLVK